MKTWKAIASHTTAYKNPIQLSKGEIVKLGNLAPEENWKDWIWAENDNQLGGWVPVQIIENLEDGKQALILENYSAKELDITKDELVIKIKSLNGWSWVRKISNNDEGWLPDEVLEIDINI